MTGWLLSTRWKEGTSSASEGLILWRIALENMNRWEGGLCLEMRVNWNLTHDFVLQIKVLLKCYLQTIFFLQIKFFPKCFFTDMAFVCGCNCASDIVVHRGIGSFHRKCFPIPPYDCIHWYQKRNMLNILTIFFSCLPVLLPQCDQWSLTTRGKACTECFEYSENFNFRVVPQKK